MAKGPQGYSASGQGPQPFGLFGGGVPFAPNGAIERYFTQLAGVNQYIDIPALSDGVGSFVYKAKFAAYDLSVPQPLIRIGGFIVRIDSDTEIRVWTDGSAASTVFTVPAISLNTLHRIEVHCEFGTNNAELILNGVSYGVVSQGGNLTLAGSIHRIGSNSSTTFLNGIKADVEVEIDGSVVRNYPVADSPDTYPGVVDISVNSQNGTYINGTANDRGLFQQLPNGNWQGDNLPVPPWPSSDFVIEAA